MRMLPESGQVLLAAAIVSASIIVRPAQPVIADLVPPELPTIVIEQEPPVVNITHEPPDILIEVQPSVVNLPPSVANEPVTVVVEPAPVLPAEIVYQDREVERLVEVRTCLNFAELPYFDLANALTVAFPGEPWSLSGSHYNGLVWHGETPQPDMTAIIGGWLAHLEAAC